MVVVKKVKPIPKNFRKPAFLEQYPDLQDKICDGIRRGCTITSIFKSLDVDVRNYYVWVSRGRKQLRGLFRDFYEAVEQAKVERWDRQKPELEKVVYKSATELREVVNRKVERIMVLSREDKLLLDERFAESPELAAKFKEDGIILKETTNVIQILPHVGTALRVLERKSPEEWGKKS